MRFVRPAPKGEPVRRPIGGWHRWPLVLGYLVLESKTRQLGELTELGDIPIQPGKNVYVHDVGTIHDGTDLNFGCALVNGRKSVYIPVVKKDTASTLTVCPSK
jgi:multidrug efflux pump subunit AcrB